MAAVQRLYLKRHENLVYQAVRKCRTLTRAQIDIFVKLITEADGMDLSSEVIIRSLKKYRVIFESSDGNYISANPRIMASVTENVDSSMIAAFWVLLKIFPALEKDSYSFMAGSDAPILCNTKDSKTFKITHIKPGNEDVVLKMSKFDTDKNSVYVATTISPEYALQFLDIYKDHKITIYVAIINGSAVSNKELDVSLFKSRESLVEAYKL